mgnify:CR=1 FL=1
MVKKVVSDERPSKINRSDRPKRVPINGYRNILSVMGQEPGWHYCWVNEDKVPRYEQAAYEFVTHDVIVGDRRINAASQIGGKVSLSVGNQSTAYLMRVLQEYYDEDMAAMHREVDKQDAGMQSDLNSGSDGTYGNVKIEQSKPVAEPFVKNYRR